MRRFLTWTCLGFAAATLPIVLTGCSSGPGRGLSLFPSQGHKLTDDAKEARDVNAHPLYVPRELEKQPLPEYTVEPGDVLTVEPVNLDSPARLPAGQPVLPDGTINLGQYGNLQVLGKTTTEIEKMVAAAVAAKTKDAGFISVRLSSRQTKVYYVVGEVNAPGRFILNGNETVLDGLMQAGGLTDKASRDNIILSRPSKPNCPRMVLPVCWRQIVQLGDTTTNYQLAPGDRIYVPTRSFWSSCFKNHEKSPCACSNNSPQQFPPYPGDSCLTPANDFRGNTEIAPHPLAFPPAPEKQP